MVGELQASVAVATPAAGKPAGLQPKLEPSGQNVNAGATKSSVQVKIWRQMLAFPQASVAV